MPTESRIELCERQQCTGCMACYQACAHNAIETVKINGFNYPTISAENCMKCCRCMSVCPILNQKQAVGNRHVDENICLAAYSKDPSVRMSSSSGGVFYELSKRVIENGGIVYGAAWNDKFDLVHKGVNNLEDLRSLLKSKYVQSNTSHAFKEVARFLDEGRKVLFCGTPCQVAGLKSFLPNKDFPNLFLVDVLCQGVPSQESFNKYIKEANIKAGNSILDVVFRDKKHGWRCGLYFLFLLEGKGGKRVRKELAYANNSYYRAFNREYFMRPSCYDCQFKNNRQGYHSDITIADFWRIGNNIPIKVDSYEKGISAVIINTENGRRMMSDISDSIRSFERPWSEFSSNGGLRSSREPKDNEDAMAYLQTHSWRETQSKYFPVTIREFILTSARLLLGQKILRKISARLS